MKMFPRWIAVLLCVCAGALIPEAIAQDVNAIELLRTKPTADGGQAYSLTLQALGLMTFLTLLPAIVLSMTAFTRIVIVLGLLRQALGTPQTPPNQVIVGLALFMTFFVMGPTLSEVQQVALKPYVDGAIPFETALDRAVDPMKKFMLAQTRESDLKLFMDLAKSPPVAAPMVSNSSRATGIAARVASANRVAAWGRALAGSVGMEGVSAGKGRKAVQSNIQPFACLHASEGLRIIRASRVGV